VLGTVPLALAVLLGFVVGVVGGLPGFPASTVAPHGLPPGAKSTVEYCRPNGVPLPMDLYTPTAAGSAQRPAPVALYIHGGGFVLGNRRTVGFGGALGNHEGALFTPLRQRLTDRGFVVASIDYRLPPATPWPAPIEDVKCAVRFLRAHAPELGIDPDRIGVWGSSAGAQLACLLGLAGPAAGFDRGQYTERSSAVQAVVDMFGCADLEHLHDSSPVMRLSVWLTLGDSTHLRHQASPTGYDPHGAPPFLILHGSGDADVPLRHSIALLQRLHAAGVPATLIEVHGADHGLNNPHQQPPPDQITAVVVEFLHTHLS
jgi:acetyl esterase/lipase